MIPIGTEVKVSGNAGQYPFERVADLGVVLACNGDGTYLVRLNGLRENMRFPDYALRPIYETDDQTTKAATDKVP